MLDVFDENVLVVANDLSRVSRGLAPVCADASDECRLRCADALIDAIERRRVILDNEAEYFDKYRAHCSMHGQPGIGDAFLRAIYERGYTDWIVRVDISDGAGGYRLPAEVVASTFDRDDLLWLAGAVNAPSKAHVVNAVDSDYREHEELLRRNGISVRELC